MLGRGRSARERPDGRLRSRSAPCCALSRMCTMHSPGSQQHIGFKWSNLRSYLRMRQPLEESDSGSFLGDAGQSHHRSTHGAVLTNSSIINLKYIPRYLARAVQTVVQHLCCIATTDILLVFFSSDLVASHATAFSRQSNRFSDIVRDLDDSQFIH